MIDAAIPLEIAKNKRQPSWPGSEAEQRGLTAEIWKMMTNCWVFEPTARTKTFVTDLGELTLSHATDLSVNSCPWDTTLHDYTIGEIKAATKVSGRTGWLSDVWNIVLEDDIKSSSPCDFYNVSARIVEMSGLKMNRVSFVQDDCFLFIENSLDCSAVSPLPILKSQQQHRSIYGHMRFTSS